MIYWQQAGPTSDPGRTETKSLGVVSHAPEAFSTWLHAGHGQTPSSKSIKHLVGIFPMHPSGFCWECKHDQVFHSQDKGHTVPPEPDIYKYII